jgi:hypothetical protein
MKKIFVVLLTVLALLSVFAFSVSAEESAAPETSVEVSENASEEKEDMGVELEFFGFGNEGLMRNLKYMGLGMLGIFVVIGVVIVITFGLNSATTKKN